ncbi:hypothetical protein D3C77_380560 [compost metagenome]
MPRGVVRPGFLEGAIPHTGVGPGTRVVVARHLPLASITLHGDGRNVAELLGRELNVEQSGVRIADLGVDHLRATSNLHRVGDLVVVLVRRQPANAQQPARSGLRQINAPGSLVDAGVLAIDSLTQYLLISPAVSGQVHGILNAVTLDVAARVDGLQHGPREAQANCIELHTINRPNVGRITA